MGSATSLTAKRMQEIEDSSIVAARISDTQLILVTQGGKEINVGKIVYTSEEIKGIVEGQVPELVTQSLATDPELRELGFVSVSNAAKALDLVEGRTIPLGNAEGVGIAITFEDGSRSFLDASPTTGGPTELSVKLIVEATLPTFEKKLGTELRTDVALPGVAYVEAFEDGSIVKQVYTDGRVQYSKPLITDGSGSIWPGSAIGDSTTYGADLPSPLTERWSLFLSDYIQHPIDNRGLSGSRLEEIAARAAGLRISGVVQGGTIPVGGSVVITNLSVDPWRAGNAGSYLADALTDEQVIVRGTLSRSGSDRIFTPIGLTAPVSTQRLSIRAVAQDSSKLLLLGAGINNEPLIVDKSQRLADVTGWYKTLTSAWTGPLVIWGVLDRGPSEKVGTEIGDYIRGLEDWLTSTYGEAYAPLRKYLASSQALEDAKIFDPNFFPTSADLAAVDVGTVPPSFRSSSSSVHLNALGHRLQARFLYRHLLMRGLVARG